LPIKTGTSGVLEVGAFGTGAGQFAEGNHDHAGVYQPLDTQLTDVAALTYASNALKVVRVNAGETAFELATPSGGSGDVATDAIWDAKGDLAVGTGANAASKLTAGTNGHVLTADSAEATGLKWAAPSGGSSSGWTLIDEGTASSVSTVIEDGIFTDDYDEYQIVLIGAKIDTDTASVILKLRASSADLTANYALAGIKVTTAGGTPAGVQYVPANGQPFWPIYGADGTDTDEYSHTIFRVFPRLVVEQRMLFEAVSRDYTATMAYHAGAGWIPGVTSDVDGFKITTSAEGSYTFDITKWRVFGR
jgi:hypothetical protein